jgi:hypothetical protein
MNSIKTNNPTITAGTTDEQIRAATKEELIQALYKGFYASLREHRRATRTKAKAVAEAKQEAARLRAMLNAK